MYDVDFFADSDSDPFDVGSYVSETYDDSSEEDQLNAGNNWASQPKMDLYAK